VNAGCGYFLLYFSATNERILLSKNHFCGTARVSNPAGFHFIEKCYIDKVDDLIKSTS